MRPSPARREARPASPSIGSGLAVLGSVLGAEPEVAADADGAAPAVDAVDGAGAAAGRRRTGPGTGTALGERRLDFPLGHDRGGFEVMMVADS